MNIQEEIEKLKKRVSRLEERSKPFKKPTKEQVKEYCVSYNVDPEVFYNYYETNGWKVGKSNMKCWKSAIRNWDERTKIESNDLAGAI